MGKKKQLIREHQAKSGQSYVTAKANVEARVLKPTSTAELLRVGSAIIALAKTRREIEERRSAPGNDKASGRHALLDEVFAEDRNDVPLRLALSALSHEQLCKLRVLMYVGRDAPGGDPDDVLNFYRTVRHEEAGVIVGVMVDKIPLDRYLRDGFRTARKQGVDLDGPW